MSFHNRNSCRDERSKEASGFLLCMLSPVWRAKLCHDLCSASVKVLELQADEEEAYEILVALGCGMGVNVTGGLKNLIHIGKIADKYGMEEVLETIEDSALQRLTLNTCGELLADASESGLHRVHDKCKALALEDFEAFARTDSFLWIEEEALEELLSDEGLCAESEEAVLAAVARWRTAPTRHFATREGESHAQREGLLQQLRFLMDGYCFSGQAGDAVPGSDTLQPMSREALSAKNILNAGTSGGEEESYAAAYFSRRASSLTWLISAEEGHQHRLPATEQVFCMAAVGRRLVCGLWSGEMQVWDRMTRLPTSPERQLVGHTRVVASVVACGRWVVSGSSDGQVRAWDPETGLCEAILWGHSKGVSGLVECGIRLLSGSDDGTVRVWELRGPPKEWRWERSLAAGAAVGCVAAWRWRAVAGGADGVIRVWDARTGVPERTLMGHGGAVLAMAVSGSRLMSSSDDSTLRKWSLVTGECEGQVEAGKGKGANKQRVRCLTTVGSNVVGGTELGQIWAWDRQSMALLHSAEMTGRPAVRTLVRNGGALLGCVGTDVMVWGNV